MLKVRTVTGFWEAEGHIRTYYVDLNIDGPMWTPAEQITLNGPKHASSSEDTFVVVWISLLFHWIDQVFTLFYASSQPSAEIKPRRQVAILCRTPLSVDHTALIKD